MQIDASSVIPHPRERVYAAYRDEMPKIAAFMDNIQEIRVLSREERPQGPMLHNEWVGRVEIPRVVQSLVQPEMVRWDDHADWDDSAWGCSWALRLRVFTNNMRCEGTNRFEALDASSTRVTLNGVLEVNLKDIPGVPRFLASSLAPQVERFIVAMVRPNLEQVNVALGRYLDQHP